jgi:tRNA(Ile)-lysidine synthase
MIENLTEPGLNNPIGSAMDSETFAALMDDLGPFEAAPHIAVAVSGGADSMALALLSHDWVRARGGAVLAISVDHGLRQDAAAECRQVRAWLANKGIVHRTLRWQGEKPHGGIQAAARQARYDLLAVCCRSKGILHLLTAHHGDDQAETLLLRLDKSSGIEGLAGMAKGRVLGSGGVRMLRPLLAQRHADLVATLEARDQFWLQDPSNRDTKYARVRARQLLACDEGRTAELLALANEAGNVRRQLRGALADLAARTVSLHPAGYCHFDPRLCQGQRSAMLQPLLADLLRCIGGGSYRPRRERVDRLAQDLAQGNLAGGRTLGGARVLPQQHGVLICREAGRLPSRSDVGTAKSGRWDRFQWRLGKTEAKNLSVGALGQEGWRQVRSRTQNPLPSRVNPVLPALWQHDRVIAVPHLNLTKDVGAPVELRKIGFSARFSPLNPLQPDGLILV